MNEVIIFGLKPLPFLFLLSVALSFAVTLVYKYATDQAVMKELKSQQKSYQAEIKNLRDNPAEMMKVQKQAMAANLRYMKHSMKPMLITIIPFLAIFTWLRYIMGNVIVIPLSFWEGHLGWIGTYVIFSMIFTTLFRKILKVS